MTCKHHHHTGNTQNGKQQHNLGLVLHPSFYSVVKRRCPKDLNSFISLQNFIYLWILGTLHFHSLSPTHLLGIEVGGLGSHEYDRINDCNYVSESCLR